jgi:membrane protein implicated in regulation of membrane protease activity
MFFGIGAILTGVAASAGVVSTPAVQWLTFTVLSVVSLLLFRGKIQSRVQPVSRPAVDSLIGETALPTVALAPGAVGRVTLRGSTWEARNDGPTALEPNQRCRVTRVSGLQVGVVAE